MTQVIEHSDARPAAFERFQANAERILIAAGMLVYIFVLRHVITSDGNQRYAALEDLILNHKIRDTKYSLIQPLASLPLWFLGKLGGDPRAVVALFNTLVFVAGLGAVYLLLRNRVDGGLLRKFLLLLIAASMFTQHVRQYMGEPFTAVLVLVGLAALAANRGVLGSASLVAGVANTPAAVGGLFLGLLPRAWRQRRWYVAVIPAIAVALLVGLEFYLKRDSFFNTGYQDDRGAVTVLPYSGQPGFSYPFFLGVLSILFSFGKGLVFFAPGLLLLFAKPSMQLSEPVAFLKRSSLLFVAGLILVYAKWWSWYGGWSWGPRYFLFASVPAALLLAIHLSDRKATVKMRIVTLAILAWSVWVAIDGAVFGLFGVAVGKRGDYALEFLTWYVPEYSVLFRPFVRMKWLDWWETLAVGYFVVAGLCLALPFGADLGGRAFRAVKRLRSRPAA